MTLYKTEVTCNHGPTSLAVLVPELYFWELPAKLKLPHADLVFSQEYLGRGMIGTVVKVRFYFQYKTPLVLEVEW